MINDFKIQLYSIMLTFLYISVIFISENNQNLVVWTNNIIFFRLNITLLYYLLILHYWPVVKHFTSKLTGGAILVLAQGSLSSLWRCWTTVTTFNKPFFPIKHSLMVDWTLLNWYFLSDWSIAFSLHLAWCYRPHFGAAWGKKLRRVWSLNPHLE